MYLSINYGKTLGFPVALLHEVLHGDDLPSDGSTTGLQFKSIVEQILFWFA